MKYCGLTWGLVLRGEVSQKELQIVAGGLVYISMFRRALLFSLNAIWAHIEASKREPPVVKAILPREVTAEPLGSDGLPDAHEPSCHGQ